jgi:uncharacterized SAM-binding protein YcdF (DUF218 family)
MLFALKKWIGYFLMPLPFCLVCAGVGLLLMRTKRAKLGRRLVITAVVLMVLFTNRIVSFSLIRPLEFRYPAIPELREGAALPPALAKCRYVVVLGAGNANTPNRAALAELSPSGLARITEGVRLLRALPEARLIVSGPPVGTKPSHATMLARAALSLGVTPDRILLLEHVRDTEDESLAVQRKIGREPFALVTSGFHMPRSVALFRHAGMDPLPCPTDFMGHDDGEWHWTDLLWDPESLQRSTWAVRERIGYLWIWLRGRG